jgi:DNA-binding response OmpR family regulator
MMLGFEVSVSMNVEEALDYLQYELPDLILTDITMPDKDGITLIRYVQSNPKWSKIPTVIVSARPRWEMASLVDKVGANAYLDKPFSIRNLHATLAPLLPFSPIRAH